MISMLFSCSENHNSTELSSFKFPETITREFIDSASTHLLRNPFLFDTEQDMAMKIVQATGDHQMRDRVRRLMISYFLNSNNASLTDDLLIFSEIYSKRMGDRTVPNFFYLTLTEEYGNNFISDSLEALLHESNLNTEELIERNFKLIFGPGGEIESAVAAERFMLFCEIYALSKPNNPRSSEFLFKAAEVAKSMGQNERSDFNIRWIINKFRDHKIAPNALFFKAFSRGELANDRIKSVKLFQEFLLYYPYHHLAKSAKILMQASGISNEELLESRKQEN